MGYGEGQHQWMTVGRVPRKELLKSNTEGDREVVVTKVSRSIGTSFRKGIESEMQSTSSGVEVIGTRKTLSERSVWRLLRRWKSDSRLSE